VVSFLSFITFVLPYFNCIARTLIVLVVSQVRLNFYSFSKYCQSSPPRIQPPLPKIKSGWGKESFKGETGAPEKSKIFWGKSLLGGRVWVIKRNSKRRADQGHREKRRLFYY
jgi:hypothetical protein